MRNHEVGIDRLAKSKHDYVAVGLLWEYASAGELEYCPNHEEVVRFGLALLKLQAEFELLRRVPVPRFRWSKEHGLIRVDQAKAKLTPKKKFVRRK